MTNLLEGKRPIYASGHLYSNVLAVTLSLAALPASAQITATVETGYDDNPFRLSDALNNDGGAFIDTEVRIEHNLTPKISIDLRGSHTFHDNEDQDADRTTYSGTLAYESDGKLFGKPTDYLTHVRVSGVDRTFVSRITGDVGQFRGHEIGDRFDQTSFEVRSRADIELSQTTTLRLQGDLRHRTYDDFSDLDLSNLDYNQIYGSAILRLRPNRKNDIRFGGSVGHREFVDREGRALDGSLLTGSQLQYELFEVQASWKYDITDHHDIRLAFNHRVRRDNLSGYFDTTFNRVGIRYRYQPDRKNRFAAQLRYGDFNFDNIPAEAIINNEQNVGPNEGISTSLSYSRRLKKTKNREIWLNSEITYDDYDSINSNFVYDRIVAKVGVSLEF